VIRAERIDPRRVPSPPLTAVLSLGSNLGDREATIRAAVADIGALDGVTVTAASSLVETPALKPHGVDVSAPAYLNAVVLVSTTREPVALLDALNTIEAEHGRVRVERWGDRTLDIDIITMGTLSIASDRLILPHLRAADRAFVLVPWLEVDQNAEIPGRGRATVLLSALTNDVLPYEAEPLL